MAEKKKWRVPYQRNYETCVIPEGLEAWSDRPLYILVAHWCRLQENWVSRRDIAQAFGISESSATFQLTYLARKKDQVVCELRRVKRVGVPVSRYEVKVLDVKADAGLRNLMKKQRMGQKRGVGNVEEEVREQLRNIWNGLQRGRN
ncbi:CaiF/GrlA family transcriptional regulator [Salmonella enterica]|nr:CaiF/GrlA family transcriptional regulator [Salmonella enterica]